MVNAFEIYRISFSKLKLLIALCALRSSQISYILNALNILNAYLMDIVKPFFAVCCLGHFFGELLRQLFYGFRLRVCGHLLLYVDKILIRRLIRHSGVHHDTGDLHFAPPAFSFAQSLFSFPDRLKPLLPELLSSDGTFSAFDLSFVPALLLPYCADLMMLLRTLQRFSVEAFGTRFQISENGFLGYDHYADQQDHYKKDTGSRLADELRKRSCYKSPEDPSSGSFFRTDKIKILSRSLGIFSHKDHMGKGAEA